jgi:hypothetical protein
MECWPGSRDIVRCLETWAIEFGITYSYYMVGMLVGATSVCGDTSGSCGSSAKSRTNVIPRVPVSIDVGSRVCDLSKSVEFFQVVLFWIVFGVRERIGECIWWVRGSISSDRRVNGE